jgi:hypothetical protein
MHKTIKHRLQKTAICLIMLGFLVAKSQAQIGVPPVIVVQPLGTTVQNGGTAVLTATAVSLTSMNFNWLFNGQPVSSANSRVVNIVVPSVGTVSTLTVSNLIPANAGNYSVRVVNGVGSVTSSNAALSVIGGISVDHVSATNTGSAVGTDLIWSHTIGIGPNRVLVVNVSTHTGYTVSSITYGGVALTQIGPAANASGAHVSTGVWYLKAPAVGTANVVVTLIAKDVFAAGATSFFGVDQTRPFGTCTNATGTANTPSATTVSAAGEVIVDSVAARAATSGTNGTGQTQLWDQFTGKSGSDVWGSSSFSAGAATVPMTWTLSGVGAGDWASVALALKPAAIAVSLVASEAGMGMTANGFTFGLSGPSGSTFVIEASTDLQNWTPISTNTAPTGKVSCTDTAATNLPFRYYRAKIQ